MQQSSNQNPKIFKSRSKLKCKRKLIFFSRNENSAMAPGVTNRESDSLNAILDDTNPEKLVQYIQKKRGLQNVVRIFPETVSKNVKRKSFPFEIVSTKPATPPPSDSENSLNIANPKVLSKSHQNNKEDKNINTSVKVGINGEHQPHSSRLSSKRSSHNLGRRVLLKTFEKIHNENEFCPVASSTPVLKNVPFDQFESIVSNINRGSSDENSPGIPEKHTEKQTENHHQSNNHQQLNNSKQLKRTESIITEVNEQQPKPVQHHNRKSHRKSETCRQPKTIKESLLCESLKATENNGVEENEQHGAQLYDEPKPVQHHNRKSHRKSDTCRQPKTITESLLCGSLKVTENNGVAENEQHGTQLYDDGIEVDETLIGASPDESPSPPLENNANDVISNNENENYTVEGTLVNEEIFEISSRITKDTSTEKTVNQLNSDHKNIRQNVSSAKNESKTDKSKNKPFRKSEPKIVLNNSKTKTDLASAKRKSESEVSHERNFSTTTNRVASELISTVASRIRESRDRKSSLLAPPSPFRSGYSPVRSQGTSFTVPPTQSPQIQPIHVSCAKSPTIVICQPVCHLNKTNDRPINSTVVSDQTKASEDIRENVAPLALNTKNHNRLSEQRDDERHPNQSEFGNKNVILHRASSIEAREEKEAEITSDEDQCRDPIQKRQSTHGENSRSIIDKEKSQSRAVDLRLSYRRSNQRRRSRTSNMARTQIYQGQDNNSHSNSDSEEDSFARIIEIDNLLKNLNNSNRAKSGISNQQNVELNNEVANKCDNNTLTQTNNPQNLEYLTEIDENIVEPIRPEDAGNGYVYDISPRLGKIYMESLLRKAKSVKPRGRKRLIPNSPLPQVTYDDIERQLKSKKSQRNRSSQQTRRKLYSKGNSEIENSSEDETQPYESTTYVNETITTSQQSTYDKKTKISKCRIRPESVKFFTIQQLIENSLESNTGQPTRKLKRKKETVNTICDDDELLFKVPEQPAPKRRTMQCTANSGRACSNIKQVLGLAQNTSRKENYHNRSDCNTSGYENSSFKNLERITVNEPLNRSNLSITPLKSHNIEPLKSSTFESIKKKKEIERLRLSATPLACQNIESTELSACKNAEKEHEKLINGSFDLDGRNTTSSEPCRRMTNFGPSAILPSIQETSIESPNDGPENNPVEPEPESENNPLTVNTSTTSEKYTNQLKKKDSSASRSRKKAKKSYTPRQSLSQLQQNETCTKSSESNTSELQVSGSLRRSARKHRPPQPYWTSRYIRTDEINYKEPSLALLRRKRKTRLPSIDENTETTNTEKIACDSVPENQETECHGAAPSEPKETRNIADELFDAVKEISAYQLALPEVSQLPAPKTAKVPKAKKKVVRKTKSKPPETTPTVNNEMLPAVNNEERHILTDSGHRTDSSLEPEENSKNLLLAWLKNLVEPNTISSYPALSNIFAASGVEIVPASTLVFRELDGVEYAYYTKGNDINTYGYMRFYPGSVKRRAKTKDAELRILHIAGVLTLNIDGEEGRINNGDLVTIHKGTKYSIANKSAELALIFFIKSS